MYRRCLLAVVLFMPVFVRAQRVQHIKGSVVDKESKMSLPGVTVSVVDVTPNIGAATDTNGDYLIAGVPVGKHVVVVSYMGYKGVILSDILVTSAHEVVLPIELEELAVKMTEVTITQRREHINDMALVSTKTFDVQEAERYAGSRADPARMASNFAGVQGADDSRNDIVVRGNSPQSVLWRMEGVDIPNPNHFAVPGTTGGPVSMLNSKTLANSDFFTGAFPAEYGDAIGGVFDLRLRNGNKDRYEFTGQLGLLGTELAAEGPISRKSGSSFLVAYRYSTLQIFQGLNIKIGTTSIPKYQDLTFKANFPIGKKSNLSVFGIGGLSKIDLIVSTLTKPEPQLYGESDRDQYFKSNTGVLGATFSESINSKTYMTVTVAQTGSDIWADHIKVSRDTGYHVTELKPILGYDFLTATTVAHWSMTKKIAANRTLKFGVINNYYNLDLTDSSRQYPPSRIDWQQRLNFKGSTDLVEAYAQYKYRPTEKLTFSGGLHGQYLTHNGSKALEPRLGMKWAVNEQNNVTVGYGMHSQMQQLYQYFARLPSDSPGVMRNYNIDFTRSHHFVVGLDRVLSVDWRFKAEVYYQYLYDVPVETRIGSSYSTIDQGSTFSRTFPDTLQNTGKGYNYGLELTFEKRFTKGYYMLITASLFDSKAMGNDGVYRNTDYNTGYAYNVLAGYEKKISTYGTLITGVKITYIGGKLYSPVDTMKSEIKGDLVVVDSQRNILQFPAYFRMDAKVGMRFNSKKVTHEIGLDLVNIFNTKNILSLTYSSDLAAQGNPYPFYTQYQLGFLPIFYYRIDFAIRKREHAEQP
jgi:hypothetical protein